MPATRESRLPGPPGSYRALSDSRTNAELGKVLATAAALLCGMDRRIIGPGAGITTTTVIAVVYAPMWLPIVAARCHRAAALMFGAIVALLWGFAMSVIPRAFRQYSDQLSIEIVLMVVTQFGMLGALLWAKTQISVQRIASWFGVGLLLTAIPKIPETPLFAKYLLAAPLGLIVLSWIGNRRSTTASVLAFLGLALFGAANDARALFGSMLLSAAILVWQGSSSGVRTPVTRVRAMVLAGLGTLGAYFLGQAILVQGLLGSEIQQRTLSQLHRGGNLLLGGRPEWSATISLASGNPFGFGLGAIPTDSEVMIAKSGLANVGIEGSSGYVENFMFGHGIELHSIIADSWAWFGIPGLALCLWIAGILFSSLTKPQPDPSVRPLAIFVSVRALFFLAFGPPASNLDDVILALVIVLPMAARRGGTLRPQA